MASTEDPRELAGNDKDQQEQKEAIVLSSSSSSPGVEAFADENDKRPSSDNDEASSCSSKRRIEERRRLWLFGFSAVYTFIYVGSFYGWGPMQLLLEDNGSFSWKCFAADTTKTSTSSSSSSSSSSSNSTVCSEQTYSLLRINLIATVTQILSPVLGQFVDSCGAKRGFFFLTACLVCGLALLTMASTRSILPEINEKLSVVVALDRLLYVAFCFLAMATWMGGLLTVHTGLFFTGHVRSRVIFILNSLFDAGSITFLFLWWLGQVLPNVNLTALAGGFLCSAVLIMSGALYFWIVAVPEEEAEDDKRTTGGTTTVLSSTLDVTADVDMSDKVASSSRVRTNNKEHEQIIINNEEQERLRNNNTTTKNGFEKASQPTLLADNNNYVIIAHRTPQQQLLSTPYLLLCAYFAIQTTSNQWNLATQRDFLAYLGDDEQGNKYLTIFTLLMPASVVALPLVDYVIVHFGFAGAFQTINALALGYTTIKVSSENLNVQILGFILFSFYRCFLFGVSISFLPTLIGLNVVGKAVGILYAVAGVLSFINIPFAKLAVQQLDGNFFIPNLIFCLFVIPCILLAFLIGRHIRREVQAKQRQQERRNS